MKRPTRRYKKGVAPLLLLLMLVTLLSLVVLLISVTRETRGQSPVNHIIAFILMEAVTVYALFGYRAKGGRLLRYVFLFHALSHAAIVIQQHDVLSGTMLALHLLVSVSTAYMAGRLDSIVECEIIIVILDFVVVILSVGNIVLLTEKTFLGIVVALWPMVVWFALSGAYLFRFNEQKEAAFREERRELRRRG